MGETCECVQCCDGEHPGKCKECAGWGEEDGEPCAYCDGDGVCPVCDGESDPMLDESEVDDG